MVVVKNQSKKNHTTKKNNSAKKNKSSNEFFSLNNRTAKNKTIKNGSGKVLPTKNRTAKNKTAKRNDSALLSASKLLSQFGATLNGKKLSPEALKQILDKAQNGSGKTIWDIVPKLGYKALSPTTNSDVIKNNVKNGYHCVVDTAYGWFLGIGAADSRIMVLDNHSNKKMYVPLNKVTGARCFKKN